MPRTYIAARGNLATVSDVEGTMKRFYLGLLASMLLAGCVSENRRSGDPAERPPSSAGAEEPSTTTQRDRVVLDQVRYECGPTDDTVVSFRAAATTEFSGTAELDVLGETFGSVDVELGSSPQEFTMEIDLSQMAFDNGRGVVRVTSEDAVFEASSPVVLRLEPGVGCG